MEATARIFLSYAREDEEKVENLYQKLSDAGFKPWMDKKDILPGERWEFNIQQAIRRSDFFLACLSAHSVSKRGFLQKEVRQALDMWQEKLEEDIYLIPVQLEDCEVPESLRKFQWVNLLEEDGWTRLVKAIQVGMERREVPADEEPSLGTEMATPEEGPERVRIAPSSLPAKTYHRLIGRFDELDQVMSALREPKRKPMVAVVGLGGIGKTALARETTERCGQENLFDHIVWASFKTEHLVGERVIQRGDISYDFDSLLSDIGRQCDRMDIAIMPSEQKKAAVAHLLTNNRILIVMDNLEAIPNREELIQQVFDILGRSRLLITSRWQVQHEQVFMLKLLGLPEEESIIFLREEGRERNITAVAEAESSAFREIHSATGGAPLAMKLVVGQMSRQPMTIVLDRLKRASAKGEDEAFYRFVYWDSWNMLDDNSRMALVDMSVFPPITGGAAEDVEKVSQLAPEVFWSAMDQLVMMSLVDKTGTAGRERFALHTLTYSFVLSDITEEWSES